MAADSAKLVVVLVAVAAVGGGLWFAIREASDGRPGELPDAAAPVAADPLGDGAAPSPGGTGASGRSAQATGDAAGERREASLLGDAESPGPVVRGRVAFPEGLPADEVLEVAAYATRWGPASTRGLEAELSDDDTLSGDTLSGDTARLEPIVSVQVDGDGSFRIELPADHPAVRRGRIELEVEGRYAFMRRPLAIELDEASAVETLLSPELGAWVTGTVVLEDGSSAAGSPVRLIRDARGGVNALRALERKRSYRSEVADDGTFEMRGVDLPGPALIGVSAEAAADRYLELDGLSPGTRVTVSVELEAGATLEGEVVDGAGQPLADAEVSVDWPFAFLTALPDVAHARTAADGTFSIPNLPLGELFLEISAEGHVTLRETLELGSEGITGQRFELAVGERIAGRVRLLGDAAESRPSGIEVSAEPDLVRSLASGRSDPRSRARATALTDANGRFELRGLSEGYYVVRASEQDADGRVLRSVRLAGVAAGEDDLTLELAPSVAMVGRVLDPDGLPVPEFRVVSTKRGGGAMFGLGTEQRDVTVLDSGDGAFRLEDLTEGTWEVRVASPTFAHSEIRTVDVDPRAPAPELLFTLEPAATVRGKVIGPLGEPVPGAVVGVRVGLAELIRDRDLAEPPRAVTDAEGRFLLADVDPGSVALVAQKLGLATSEGVDIELASGEVREGVLLQLRRGALLTGEVLDRDGRPRTDRSVIVQSLPDYTTQIVASVDEDGEFRVEALAPGKWQLLAIQDVLRRSPGDVQMEPGEMLADLQRELVELADGEERHVVLGGSEDLQVEVTGRVTHLGEPVGGAAVQFVSDGGVDGFRTRYATTESDGGFRAQLDRAGDYLVVVETYEAMGLNGAVEFRRSLGELDEAPVWNLELPTASLAGRVTDGRGSPLEGVRVSLVVDGGVRFGSFTGERYGETLTDAEGRYGFLHLEPGRYQVLAGGALLGGAFGSSTQFGREVRDGVEVALGEALEGIDFELARGGTLRGTVRDAQGDPVSGASVFVRDEQGRVLERITLTVSDGSGRFRVSGLGEGRYTASARFGGSATDESAPVEVSAEREGEVTIRLADATVVEVEVIVEESDALPKIRVLDADGRDHVGMVSAEQLVERLAQGFSGTRHRVGPVPPGRYTVIASLPDGRTRKKTVQLDGQPERQVKLRLR